MCGESNKQQSFGSAEGSAGIMSLNMITVGTWAQSLFAVALETTLFRRILGLFPIPLNKLWVPNMTLMLVTLLWVTPLLLESLP